jgi:protein SCO1/2
MKEEVGSRQQAVGSKDMKSREQKFRVRRQALARGLSLIVFCLLPAAYCQLVFGQSRIYNGTSPLYSPRPELGPTGSGMPPALREVKIEQRLNEQIPLDAEFKDETGRKVRLSEYFKGTKPVLLSLVFYKCPMLCNQILNGVLASARSQAFTVGKEYDILTVSFDPRETPALAAEKKASYIERYNRPGAESGWHFLTGDEVNIRRLTDAVGFIYNYDEKTDQFAHASGIMLLTPEGRLARYFYGIEYGARDIRLGLVEASANKIGSLTDQLLLYCYHYDPATGTYGPAVINIMRAGGVATVLGITALILVLRRKGMKASGEARLRQGGTA